MGSSATNFRLQLHTAVTSCPGWPGTGSPATNAEIQNPYLLYVLLLELSLSLTSMKCFWLRTPYCCKLCLFLSWSWLSQHIEILICCLLASITTIYVLFCKIWNTNIYHCPYCFLLLNLIFNNTNNILTLIITHTLHLPSQQTK